MPLCYCRVVEWRDLNAIYVDVLFRRDCLEQLTRCAEEQDYERVWRLDTESRQHWPLPRRGKTPPGVVREDCAHEERQDSTYRWTFRRDKRATRRLPPYRLRGSERGDVDRGPPSDASGGGHGRSALHCRVGVLITVKAAVGSNIFSLRCRFRGG